jgi:hypothetical protein
MKNGITITILLGLAVAVLGSFILGPYRWVDGYSQSSAESTNTVAELLWNRESILTFDVYESKVPPNICIKNEDSKIESVTAAINGKKLNYKYRCDKYGGVLLLGESFVENAQTMHAFELSEKRGEDVSLLIWGKIFTFDAAGYTEAVKNHTKSMQSL